MPLRNLIRLISRFVLTAWILTVSLSPSPAYSSEKSYDLTDTSGPVFFLGDVIKIDMGWCLPTKKLSKSLAKKRLEIYKLGKWSKVGTITFIKSDRCKKKTPYLAQYRWEVDELGTMNPDQISGNLRLRNAAVKPTIYSKVNIFESESAYQEAERKTVEERTLRAGEILMCVIKGGEWNSQGEYCVVPNS